MYEATFGLSCAPFRTLPDPQFYLDEGQYGSVLAQLIGGVEAGQPCLLLTGPAGSGKTAMVRRLVMLLDRSTTIVGTMFASAGADGADVLRAAMHAFDLARPQTHPGRALDDWLLRQTAQGGRVLLIVDEAEHLDEDGLRELAKRLVPDSKTPGLQLCLVGQEAPAALAGAVRAGLLPAVAVHCSLRALDADETRDYVLHRLRCASWTGRPAFDRATTDAIHCRSAGIPRRIHRIADDLLQQLALDEADVATAAAVEIADDRRTVELQGRAPVEPVPVNVTVQAGTGSHVGTTSHGFGAPAQSAEPTAAVTALLPIASRWPTAQARRAAAAAMVLALAVIGNGWWPGVGRAVPPQGLQRTSEPDTARSMTAAPADGIAQPPSAATPAADTAFLALTEPAPGSAAAGLRPKAGPTPPAPPALAPPPMEAVAVAAVVAVAAGAAGSGVGQTLLAPPVRHASGSTPSTRFVRDASPSGSALRNARRAAEAVPADTVAAVEPQASTVSSTPSAAPQGAPCGGTAAVLGLCAVAPLRTPPTPRIPQGPLPAATSAPAAEVVMPAEPLRAARPAPPCDVSRAALGLCEP